MNYKRRPLKNILYIEDDVGLARLLQIKMERFGYHVDIVNTGEEGIESYKTNNYEIILVDNYLPGMSGIEVLKTLKLSEYDTPFIFLTSSGDEKLAIEALQSGAADYLIKDSNQTYLELLPSVMAAAHTRVELLKQTKEQDEALRNYAEKLIRSQERLNMALDSTDTGVWDWNITTNELFYTDNMRNALEVPQGKEATIEHWLSRAYPEDRDALWQAVQDHLNGKEKTLRVLYRRKTPKNSSREWTWVLARGLAQFDKDNKPVRMVGTSTDFTVFKEMEEQLADARDKAEKASNAKSDFLATMSHEIRTPMNAIIGLTDILTNTKLDNRQKEIISTLQSSAGTLLMLINDLLDITRIEANQVELEMLPVNICSLITDVTSMLAPSAHAKKIDFKVDCDDLKGMHFIGDKLRIRQIVTNLCGNALKFTDKGHITIEAKAAKKDKDNYEVSVRVIDSGIGIPADKLDAIFNKFVQADQSITRRFGGTGLGLSISSSLAEQMGGIITVESKLNHGSTFILTLPLKLGKVEKDEETKNNVCDENSCEELKPFILLVEDYPANIMVAEMLLESMGYEFEVANNGFEAVDKITANPEKYNVILMDVQMHGMDGFEATRAIRKMEKEKGWKKHSIIGATAHALAGDRERCINAGMTDYITKPLNASELQNKIEDAWKK